MDASVTCPRCGRSNAVPPALSGKKVRCPGCAAVITVPMAPVVPAATDTGVDEVYDAIVLPDSAATPAPNAAPAPPPAAAPRPASDWRTPPAADWRKPAEPDWRTPAAARPQSGNPAARIAIGLVSAVVAGVVSFVVVRGTNRSGPGPAPDVTSLAWKQHRSEPGGYTVLMPGDPVDNRQTVPTPVGELVMYQSSYEQGNLMCAVAYCDYPPHVVSSQQPDQLLRNSAQGAATHLKGTLRATRPTSLKNAPGIPGLEAELLTADGSATMVVHYYLSGRRLFQVMIGGKGLTPASPLAEKFLGSFALDERFAGEPPIPLPQPKRDTVPRKTDPPPTQPELPAIPQYEPPRLRTDARPDEGPVSPAPHGSPVVNLTVSPDGETLASADESGRVNLSDAATGTARLTINTGQGHLWGLAFTPDGRQLITAGTLRDIKLWSAQNGKLATSYERERSPTYAAVMAPNGRLYTWIGDANRGQVRVKEIPEFRSRPGWEQTDGGFGRLALSPDGQTLAVADNTGNLRLLDTRKMTGAATVRKDGRAVTALAWSPDGKFLARRCGDGSLRLWDVAERQEWVLNIAGQANLAWISFSPDSKLLVTGAMRERPSIWSLADLAKVGELPGATVPESPAVFINGGKSLAAFGAKGAYKVWELAGVIAAPRESR